MNRQERIKILKDNLLIPKRKISFERSKWYTKSFKQTESEPIILRRAKATKMILENMQISIRKFDMIAGDRDVSPRSGVASPEMCPYWIKDELDTMETRPQDQFRVSEEQKKFFLDELYPYWEGNSLKDSIDPLLPENVRKVSSQKIIKINQTDKGQGHIIPAFEKILNKGIKGIIEQVNEHSIKNRENDFYMAASITLDALQTFIQRYIDLATDMINAEQSDVRKQELKRIVEASKNIKFNVPNNFFEAVQLFWYVSIALQVESNASSISVGRFDQFMYPFYKKDLENGVSRDELGDTLCWLWLKMNDVVLLRSEDSAKYFAGFPTGYTTILGGLNPKTGQHAVNDLSFLVLETYKDIKLPQPNLGIRVNEFLPDDFTKLYIETIKMGTGMPHIFNDEVIIPGLLAAGVSLEDARDYSIVGCVEISLPGKLYGLHDIAMYNFTKLLDVLMQEEADKIKSYDHLIERIEELIKENVELMVIGSNIVDKAHGNLAPIPLLSTLMDGCVENGIDVANGGCKYNFSGVQGIGIPNLVDSLEIIRNLVYETNELTLIEFANILKDNWKNNEPLRQRCINRFDKYGNDIDHIDQLGQRLLSVYNVECNKYKNVRGGIFSPGSYTVSANIPLGEVVGATPDGRLAGEQLADGGLSPMVGRDRQGPTAILKSVSKLDNYQTTNGTLLNVKFSPSVVEGDAGTKKMIDYVRTFMRLKIQHIQFNIISVETLRDAQKNPEKYHDLVIRVAGYSALFVDLNSKTQNDIISRTEHDRF